MNRLISISKASEILDVSITTLRRWESEGKLIPEQTRSGHRRYDLIKIKLSLTPVAVDARKTIAYARVSSADFEIISDLGSGMNYYKKGLKRLLNDVISGRVQRLVITHKDRLLRFGAELVFAISEVKQVEVVIINQGEDATFEEDLAKDVLEIITVFSARLYGSRSRQNQKLLDDVKKVVEDNASC